MMQKGQNKMPEAIITESPFVGVEDESTALITEVPMCGFINLRGSAGKGRTKYATQIRKTLGIAPPIKPNTFNHSENFRLFWMGPDELLLITSPDQQFDVVKALEDALVTTFHSVTDVSSAYAMIELSGRYAEVLLRKGCPLDLHLSVFPHGSCAQTVIAQAGALLFRKKGSQAFAVCVRRSYADYLLRWLNNVNTGY